MLKTTTLLLILFSTVAVYSQQNANAFRIEAAPYTRSMQYMAKAYDANMVWASSNTPIPPTDAAAWTQIMADLAAVDQLCRKYGPFFEPKYKPREFVGYYKAWCDLAADPKGTREKAVLSAVDNYVTNHLVGGDVANEYQGFYDPTDSIPDRFQEMAWESGVFRRQLTAEITAEYAKAGVTMPASYMDDYWRDYAQLVPKVKARAERTMNTTSWAIPTRRDAVLEKLVRSQYAKLPNAAKIEILSVGFVSSNWSSVEELTWISTVDNVSLYRVNPGAHKFRRGYVIAKVRDRPACQAREFTLRQDKGRPAVHVEYLSRGGRFIKCP